MHNIRLVIPGPAAGRLLPPPQAGEGAAPDGVRSEMPDLLFELFS
jgi:hypothetical protein